ncbi:DEAD-box ATP-dependent RNA helicase 14-like [Phalaenopsis equestris]|uniref:DEAD-box ATP-dependent RNA helicase 14-like n=1 Tax=Phalaenopsis equestris TaxID=78828 RepID=UPI0009E3FED9|nr:DEAD-box ATP-dependent RNA helicase 14-like [Phalaenopsis equestris]
MLASATTDTSLSSSKGRISYAPADPTLAKPWRGLIDSKTGYLYFWNPETNVTQYEKPLSSSPPPIPQREDSPSPATVEPEICEFDQPQKGNAGSLECSQNHVSGPEIVDGEESYMRNSQTNQDSGVGLSVEAYRRRHEITVIGTNVPNPYITFESTGFPSEILREIGHAGFSAPTPIQAQSWPIALQDRDIVAVAKTGSGKTLGYLIPGFIHLKRLNKDARMGPTVLVLSPTRELATQIHDEATKFGKSSRILCACLYGGAPKGPQLRDIDRGVHVVVATPGRLNDILEMKRLNLDQVSYLVLDEADRMLDMGFEPQIRKIVKEIPPRRQTLMYTATWPKEVRKIASDLLVKPVQINIGSVDELAANKAITQHVEVISNMQKRRRLEQILLSNGPSKYIVFCSTKRMCDQLAEYLEGPFGASAIHGDKSQMERDRVLSDFRSGKSPILVATDVAARGLDIKDIRFVINYDFPTGVEDYVHRIGRTGRAGATGVAYTFFCDQDSKHASDLVKVLEGADQQVPSELRDMASRSSYGTKFRRWASDSSYGYNDQGSSQDRYSLGRQDQDSNGDHRNEHHRNYGGNGGGDSGGCYLSFSPGPTDDDGGYRSRSRSQSPNHNSFSEAAPSQNDAWTKAANSAR